MSPQELERSIPDAAYEAGELVALSYVTYVPSVDARDISMDVLHATAPLICAHELRRMADELEVVAREMSAVDDRNIRSSALGEGVRRLRVRADELDGGAP